MNGYHVSYVWPSNKPREAPLVSFSGTDVRTGHHVCASVPVKYHADFTTDDYIREARPFLNDALLRVVDTL